MFDLEIINELTKYKNQKINILQIGFTDYETTIWLLKNIIENKDSKIFFFNTKYLINKNMNMNMNMKILKNDKEFIDIMKKEKEYKDTIIDIKKNIDELFYLFTQKNILFDIILINGKVIINYLNILIKSIHVLKKDGMIFITNTDKSNSTIEIFLSMYKNDVSSIQIKDNYIIQKKIKDIISLDLPIYIQKILNIYNEHDVFNIYTKIPISKFKINQWDFNLNNNYTNGLNSLNYDYQIEKYIEYLYDIKKSRFDYFKNIDLNYFLIIRHFEILKLYNLIKKKLFNKKDNFDELIKKIKMNQYSNFKFDKLFKNHKILNNKKQNVFILSTINKKTPILFKYFCDKNHYAQELMLKKIGSSICKNKSVFIKSELNLFHFDNILNICKNIHQKYNFVHFNLCRYIVGNHLIQSYKYYQNILLLNLLYLLLHIQKEKGDFNIVFYPITNNTQIQILQILSKYYKNITMERYFNYSNYYSIVIKAFDFKGISKEELDDFYHHYYPFFEKHIEPHVEDMFLGKKIEGLYLDNIISNKIDKKIVKAVSTFNKQYYKDFLTNLKMKIDIYDFLHNKTTTKEQKNYIYDKIFQYQYKRFVEETRKMYGTKIK